jgi:hypothetical protein
MREIREYRLFIEAPFLHLIPKLGYLESKKPGLILFQASHILSSTVLNLEHELRNLTAIEELCQVLEFRPLENPE